MTVTVKRVYEPANREDGTRVLVDRYWPRGLRKEQANLGRWMKAIAPSPELISWFGHRAERWDEFKRRYWEELDQTQARADLEWLREQAGSGTLTLVYGARDKEYNNAVALAEYLARGI
jgi:uncharacterized protein YeaO (DUF488 family)